MSGAITVRPRIRCRAVDSICISQNSPQFVGIVSLRSRRRRVASSSFRTLLTDQRGVERPQGEACDSGAYELAQGPQTKADCKNSGLEEVGFKNQGQCIASLQKEQAQTAYSSTGF